MVRTWCFHCRGPSSIPGWGTRISQVMWRSQKKKKNLNTLCPCLNPCQGSHFTSCETTHARLLPLPRCSGHAVLACALRSQLMPRLRDARGPPPPCTTAAGSQCPPGPPTPPRNLPRPGNSHPGRTQGPAWCAVSTRCPLLRCRPRPTVMPPPRDLTGPLVDALRTPPLPPRREAAEAVPWHSDVQY